MAAYLRRGLAAGLLVGLLAGLFGFFFGEPALDRAVQLEGAARGPGEAETEAFARATQKVGLFFVTGLSGSFFGGLFGLAFAHFRGRLASESEWARSVSLAAAIFAGAVLMPFLKYPANPPGVGDTAAVGGRTGAYFAMVALSLLAVLGAWEAARALRKRGIGQPVRQVTVALALAVVMSLLFVALPDGVDPGAFPAGLLWDFRLSSLGTLLVFWAGLGALFGALCERAARRQSR